MNLAKYVLRRAAISLVAIVGAVALIFFITHVLPGNPILARVTMAPPGTIEQINRQLGLDRPVYEQFLHYMQGLTHGDLGSSWVTGRPVLRDLMQRAPASLELGTYATILAVVLGVPLGIFAAIRPGTLADWLARTLSALAVSTPAFWVGMLLIYLFYFRLPVAAAPMGRLDPGVAPPHTVTGFIVLDSLIQGNMDALKNALSHFLLPTVTLAFTVIAPLVRITRATMKEVLSQPYITAARAFGLSERQVVFHDALQNSLVEVLTVTGLVFGYLVSGSVLVEQVFAWPGIGQYAFSALVNNDFAAIQGFVLLVALTYVFINWVIDALYAIIDHRVRV